LDNGLKLQNTTAKNTFETLKLLFYNNSLDLSNYQAVLERILHLQLNYKQEMFQVFLTTAKYRVCKAQTNL